MLAAVWGILIIAGACRIHSFPAAEKRLADSISQKTLARCGGVPFPAEPGELCRKPREPVERMLLDAGYRNVVPFDLHDISVIETQKNGELTERVTVDGGTDYRRGRFYARETQIVIAYHGAGDSFEK